MDEIREHGSYMIPEEKKEQAEKAESLPVGLATRLGRKEHVQLGARRWGVDLAEAGLDPYEMKCRL